MTWSFEWIQGGARKAPPALCTRWDAAFEDHGNIWQCREFVVAWETIISPVRQQVPILMVAHDTNSHEMVYPLFLTSDKSLRFKRGVIEPMGGRSFCDYQDALSTGAEMLPQHDVSFWRTFRKELRGKLLEFGALSEFLAYRLSPSAGKHDIGAFESDISPVVSLKNETGLDSYLARRSKKLRQHISKGLKLLRERGCHRLIQVEPAQIASAMEEFCDSYEKQWGREGNTHMLQLPGTREFWTALAMIAGRLHKLHFSSLTVGGEHWHWHLGFEHRGVILWYKLTYDRKFAQYSPGSLHLALIIDDAIRRGVERLDLGFGSEDYKFRWTDDASKLLSVSVQRAPRRLAVARTALALVRKSKRTMARMRGYRRF